MITFNAGAVIILACIPIYLVCALRLLMEGRYGFALGVLLTAVLAASELKIERGNGKGPV